MLYTVEVTSERNVLLPGVPQEIYHLFFPVLYYGRTNLEFTNRENASACHGGDVRSVQKRMGGFPFEISPREANVNPMLVHFPSSRREVAAGVKSECVRKGDRTGKLAKTARKLLAERDGASGNSNRDKSVGPTSPLLLPPDYYLISLASGASLLPGINQSFLSV
ncbi:hypothetical protein ALC53_09717 [Atta colombica]|uniref:Uncharacterized protein n=1 Tax=Atta colombica TaxID=520822 RepID=A0A195B6B2_9HYME|nr:hypothetical protein ALC53_09717 [Atta colombica]